MGKDGRVWVKTAGNWNDGRLCVKKMRGTAGDGRE